MQRKWRRAWLRGKLHFMSYHPVRKIRTHSITSKVYNVATKVAKKFVPVAAAAGVFLSTLTGVQANPSGGTVASGTGSISGQGTNHVTINQASDKLSINWNSFSIASGEKVQFIQPGASSIALNRVLGNNASSIYGQLSANGKVFLINPNGVLFAKGAQVNVGGLVASTLQLSDKDFLSGKYTFSGDSQQGVLNQGNITAANGSYVALLGANAANEGVILAKEGTAALGAGSKVSLDFTGDGLLTLSVDESKVKAEVKNSGLIKADGGLVVMNAKAADALTGSVVNNTGTIEAKSVTSKNGAIILAGDTVTNAGTLDASGKNAGETGGTVKVLGDTVKLASGAAIDVSGDKGGGTALVGGAYQGGTSEYAATNTVVEQGTSINADALTNGNGGQVVVWANDTTSFAGSISAKGGKASGNGGSVETSGHKTLTVADTARVNTTAAKGKTGNWLLDPVDFVVDDTGNKGMTATALSAVLQNTSVTITTTAVIANSTSGVIKTDTSGNGDITISSAVNWSADSNVLTLNAYRNININANVTASGAKAGLALTYGTNTDGKGGAYSLGSGAKITLAGENAKFSLNGSDYTVINSHSTGGALSALQNINNNLSGKYFLGEDIDASATKNWDNGAGFTPIGNDGTQFTGTFDGGGHNISGLTINRSNKDFVGMFGSTKGVLLSNIGLVNASMSGREYVGGLVGMTDSTTITNSYVTGSVKGTGDYVGGLVGLNTNHSTITNSYATASVNGTDSVGGLVGSNSSSTIANSYATGSVNGTIDVGGLVGYNSSSTIANSYATGSVKGTGGNVGGLVGSNYSSFPNIMNSYATGLVIGTGNNVGGLAGYNQYDTITNSYWDADTTRQNKGVGSGTTSGVTALYSKASSLAADATRKSAFSASSYSWFDASGNSADWYMIDGSTRPFLRSEYSTTITNAHQLQLMAMDLQGFYTLGKTIDMGELTSAAGMWRTAVTADSSDNYGFASIGTNSDSAFRGSFDGGGHTVNGLIIYRDTDNVGLFGYIYTAGLSDIGLVNANVKGSIFVGGLVGYSNESNIKGSWVDGRVTGSDVVGGLAGLSNRNIEKSYNTSSVKGSEKVGGLVGYNVGDIYCSYNTGRVEGSENVGGLAGYMDGGSADLTSSYSTGTVIGTTNVGGLLGHQMNGIIDNCYASGSVTGTGDSSIVGGLLGSKDGQYSVIKNSYWDVTATGQAKGVGNQENDSTGTHYTGLTSDQMKRAGNFSGWDKLKDSNGNNVWYFYDGYAAPYLRCFLTPLMVSADSAEKVYDGSVTAPVINKKYTPSTGVYDENMVAGDLVWSGVGNVANVGSYGLRGLYTTNQQGYMISYDPNAKLTITPRKLTATATAQNKVYDGNYSATVTGVNFGNLVDGENMTANYTSGAFIDKNVGDNKTITLTDVTMTADNPNTLTTNYLLPTEVTTTADITKRQLTATATAQNKVYDGNYSATVTGVTFSNFADGESMTANYTGGTYETKDAHNGIKVTVNGVTMTADNPNTLTTNYQLPTEVTTTADITKRQLTATATAQNKVYDCNYSATVTGVNFDNLVDGESLTANYAGGTYDTKNAGNGIKVTVNGVGMTVGANTLAANYQLPIEVTTTADITKRQLTSTAAVQNKVYDGKTNAIIDRVTFGNVVDGEMLTADYTGGTFNDKHVGDNKAVTVSGLTMTAGANTLADNYLLPTNVDSNASITPAALTITAITNTKTYDGTNTANATPTYNSNDVKTGDKLTVSEIYDNKNAGTDKTLTVNYVMNDGNGGKNYNIITQTATGTINQKDLTIAAITNTKTYDGTNTANATPTYNSNDVQTGDALTVSETYDNKNAGTDKTLTVNYVMNDGNGGKNYNIITQTATGTINQKDLTITAITNTKTYDGTNTANATPTYNSNDVKTGDTLTVSETYDNKNAGTNKTLTVSYVMDDGNDGKNYNVTTQTATGTINQKDLTIKAITNTKTYDGTNTANATPTYNSNDVKTGDNLTVSETYDNKNAGTDKTLTVNYVMDDGNGGKNYNVTTQTATGTINQKDLTITAITNTKTYDGTNTANATPTYNSNDVKTGDTLTVSETYDNKNAGTNKTLTVSYVMDDGNDGKNYNVITQTATGTINQKDLTIKAVTNTKTYDGTNTANAMPTYNSNDVKTGDTLTVSETYNNKNAGTNKTLTVSYVMDDGNGGKNYNVTTQTATGTINQQDLTIKAVANTKTYDGTNTANATPTYNSNDVQTGDKLTVSEIYDNKNAGADRNLTVNYVMDDGNDGKNYNVTTQTATGTINQATLTIAANNDAKIYDKTAYAGGKGVSYTGLATGETGSDLSGSLTYSGTSQGATEVGTYTITPSGLTSTNYTIAFQDGTLTVKPVLAPTPTTEPTPEPPTIPQIVTQPEYTAAVASTRQAVDTSPSAVTDTTQPAASNSASATSSPQATGSQLSSIQFRTDSTGPVRTITTSGQKITISQDSLVQLQLDVVQKDIAVYQTAGGSISPAATYHLDSSQGSLALREGAASLAPFSREMPASVSAQAESSSFQLTDSQGNTANFTIAYTGGSLYVQGANAAATDMLSQNQQLVTATSLVAVQDKLSIDIKDLKAVCLAK